MMPVSRTFGGLEIYLLGNFSPTFECVKGLAGKVRDILFGTGTFYTKTPEKPETLYGPIIPALDNTIRNLKW